MIKDITFGQYFPGKSALHRLDPRMKLCLLVAFIVFIFLCKNIFSLVALGIFTLIVMLLSRVPLGLYMKNLKAVLIVILLTTVLNAFYVDTGRVLVDFWIIKITADGVLRALFMSFRIIVLIVASSVLTYTTTPTELTDAIERLLKPLKYIGLGEAVHTMAMMLTIALRFIPTLIEETEKIMGAQKARGADMENGTVVQRVKSLIPILIPLLMSSVRRAYELADAMECRCYTGGNGRQRMKQLRLSALDYCAAAVCCVAFATVLLLNALL